MLLNYLNNCFPCEIGSRWTWSTTHCSTCPDLILYLIRSNHIAILHQRLFRYSYLLRDSARHILIFLILCIWFIKSFYFLTTLSYSHDIVVKNWRHCYSIHCVAHHALHLRSAFSINNTHEHPIIACHALIKRGSNNWTIRISVSVHQRVICIGVYWMINRGKDHFPDGILLYLAFLY